MPPETTQNSIPPIKDRIVTIGNDRLVPLELTPDELRQIFAVVNEVKYNDARLRDYFSEGWLGDDLSKILDDELTQLEAEFPQGLIPLEKFFPHDSILDSFDLDSFKIVGQHDPVYVAISRPSISKARKQEKFWEKRFQAENGREPTREERDNYLFAPGYQLQVLGWDEDARAQVSKTLEDTGFPVSQYRGLEEDEVEEEVDPNEIPTNLLKVGRPGSKFREQFEIFLAALEDKGEVTKMALDGKISKSQAARFLESEKARREYALELTKFVFEESVRAQNPDFTDEQIRQVMLMIDVDRIMGRF